MRARWMAAVAASTAALGLALAGGARPSAQAVARGPEVLDEHPAIQYAARPTTDRVAALNAAVARGAKSLPREADTGYLRAVLDALGVPIDSQLLVFSKTGVQRGYTSPQNPRALYFNRDLVVGYIRGAPLLELAAQDRQQGVVFYTLDQASAAPAFIRRTSCLMCHVSTSTLEVPGMLVRSHGVGETGNVMRQFGSTHVTHATPHPDRWGGWFVTSNAVARYTQGAHSGNVTLSPGGVTSNEVFVNWIDSAPETHGYLSASSDIVSLLVFDHQMHAMNLLTRLNWESRVGGETHALVDDLAEYLLFVREAPLGVPLTPRPGFAAYLESLAPKDANGRSFGQLDLTTRLLRYPCSYMVYADAFDALAPDAKRAVYGRMIDILSRSDPRAARTPAADRLAILDILRATKPDFPAAASVH